MKRQLAGSLTVNGKTLTINTNDKFHLKTWNIRNVVQKENVSHYNVEVSINQTDEDDCYAGTSHYSCNIFEKDGVVYVENLSCTDEE